MKATLLYIVDPITFEVLFAIKGRKIGAGFLFGYGGKFEEEDRGDARSCVCREFKKESGGVSILKYYADLQLIARIRFFNKKELNPLVDEPSFEVDCFRLFAPKAHFAKIKSTDEMKDPQWIFKDAIPFGTNLMKPGDEFIVPNIINGTCCTGHLWFDKETNEVLGKDIILCSKETLAE